MKYAEFLEVFKQESGVAAVSGKGEDTHLDDISGWNSIFILAISNEVMERTGCRADLSKVFESQTLGELWKSLT